MVVLEVFGESGAMGRIARRLDEIDGVSRVRVLDATHPGHSVIVAAVRPRVADTLLHDLRGQGVPDDDITLARVEVIGRAVHARAEAAFVWEDVLGIAWLNARPIARYLAFMLVAGVIACYGVIERNGIRLKVRVLHCPMLIGSGGRTLPASSLNHHEGGTNRRRCRRRAHPRGQRRSPFRGRADHAGSGLLPGSDVGTGAGLAASVPPCAAAP